MARASPPLTNFTAGELSPRLDGRTDFARYFNGCKKLQNFTVQAQGGVARRPGFQFVAEARDGSLSSPTKSRLIPFEFNVTQSYILEFGNNYFRVLKDDGIIVFDTEYTINSINTTSNIIVGVVFSQGDILDIGDQIVGTGMIDTYAFLNSRVLRVNAEPSSNTYDLRFMDNTQINNAGTTYTHLAANSKWKKVVQVTTTYTEAQLPELKFTQSADILYITHPSHPPRQITRTSHTAWTLTDVDLRRGPFLDQNVTSTTLSASARTGSSITVTASANTFASTDVGRLIKIYKDGYLKITAYTNATTVTATAQENSNLESELTPSYTATTISFAEGDPDSTGLEHNDRVLDSAGSFVEQGFEVGMKVDITGSTSNNVADALIVQVTDDTILFAPSVDLVTEAAGDTVTITGDMGATKEWSLGAFSETTGYPGAVTLYEQRLVFAATTFQPQTLFFSVGGDFTNFTLGIDADDALTYTLASGQVNAIRYLVSAKNLLVGTAGGEFIVRASGLEEPLSATNAQIKRISTYGSADIQAIPVANVALFVQRAKRKVREMVYEFDADNFYAPDLTILAEHITKGLIKEMAYAQEPESVLWCVLDDGKLLGMTYKREEKIIAWHEHLIGGHYGTATITLTNVNNIEVGSTVTITVDGVDTVFTMLANGATASSQEWALVSGNNNSTATNLQTSINNHASFTATISSNVITVKKTTSNSFITLATTDTTNIACVSEDHAKVESVSCISADGSEDDVYIIVNRTINGVNRRYIEKLNSGVFSAASEGKFVDSGLTYSGSSATSITGLHHLEGEVVSIQANGAAVADTTVSSGAVSVSSGATIAHIGYGFTSKLQTMRIDAGGQEGTSQGKIKRISDITIRVLDTVGILVGAAEDQLDRIAFRQTADAMTALSMFSGDKDIEFRGGFDQDGFIVVQQDQPLPMTVLAIFPRLQAFDQ